ALGGRRVGPPARPRRYHGWVGAAAAWGLVPPRAGRMGSDMGARGRGRYTWAAHAVIAASGCFVGLIVAAGVVEAAGALSRGGWRFVDLLALLALPLPVVLLLRRPSAEGAALRRVARGVRSIEGEVERLGPAF